MEYNYDDEWHNRMPLNKTQLHSLKILYN